VYFIKNINAAMIIIKNYCKTCMGAGTNNNNSKKSTTAAISARAALF